MRDNRYRILLSLTGVVVVLDQLSKLWVMKALAEYQSVPVIAGCFDLVHFRNRGAAFGFLNRSDIEWQFWLFFGATVLATWGIFSVIRTAPRHATALFAGLGLVLGGAVGNLIDRLRFRAVVDFLDFYIGQWHWPAFNVADSAICCGAVLVCLSLWQTRSMTEK